ncbi:MAG: hypothetical protein ACM3SS_15525 [Rhodospirillaceae bacterium]
MKRSDGGTKLDTETKHKKPPQPAAQTGKDPRNARDDEGKLAENQRELGVGEDHKTEEMKRGHRGTFP